MNLQKIKKNKGFVILFAVTISSILLAIALGVSNIALKEVKFGTSARETNNAFFAADTGVECALIHDKSGGSLFVSPGSPILNCNNTSISTAETPAGFWTFVVPGIGEDSQSCASVTVDKTASPVTTVISKGYNIGDASCSSTNPNRIERELLTRYVGGGVPPPPPPPVLPLTPSGLIATTGSCGTGTINVSWNASIGATSYTLRDGAVVIYTGAGTSFPHSGLTAGSSHSYSVLATNAAGSSAYSSAVSGTAPVACAPSDACGTYSGVTPRLTEPTTNPTACNPGTYANSPADTTTVGAQAWNWSCGVVTTCTAPKYGCRTTTDTNFTLPQYGLNGPNNNSGCAGTCANGGTSYPTCTPTGPRLVHQANGSSAGELTLNIPISAPTSGNTLILAFGSTSDLNNATISSVEGGGVSWIKFQASNNRKVGEIWYGYSSGIGPNTVTITLDNISTGFGAMAHISEWSGIVASMSPTAVQDSSGSWSGTGATATTASIPTTKAKDLIIALVRNDYATSSTLPANSFIALYYPTPLYGSSFKVAYRVATSTGFYSTSWTLPGAGTWDAWETEIAAFKSN